MAVGSLKVFVKIEPQLDEEPAWDSAASEQASDERQALADEAQGDYHVKVEPIDPESTTDPWQNSSRSDEDEPRETDEDDEKPAVLFELFEDGPTTVQSQLGRLSTRFGLRRCSVRLQRIADQHLTHLRSTEPRNYDLIYEKPAVLFELFEDGPTTVQSQLGQLSTRFGLRRCSVRLQRIADQHLTHLRRTEPRNYDLISGVDVAPSPAQPVASAHTRYVRSPAPIICEHLLPGRETVHCQICNKTYSHGSENKSSLQKYTHVYTRRLHSCKICKKTFTKSDHLKKHIQIHTGVRSFSCTYCNKTFITSSDMKKHNRIHTGERPFPCKICKKTFTRSDHLKNHIQFHTGVRSFSCTYCNKTFITSSDMKKHNRIHTGERPFSCKICEKTFIATIGLKRHFRIHTGERQFSCKICKKTFGTSSHLKRHTRVHTGERPFSCKICNNTFTTSGPLKTHIQIHTGERPFSCKICKKTFGTSSDLKRHTRVHTGERQFSCKICKKTFGTSSHLKRHTRVHTGERPLS